MKKSPFFDRKYLGRVVLGALSAILATLSVVYLGYHMASGTKEGVDIMYATAREIPQNVYCDGYIIRDESIIEGTASGTLAPAVADGERVRSGNKVADIYNSASHITQAKIALVESQIDFYEKCAASHISVGDTSSVNKSLSEAVLEIRRAVDSGNVSAALSKKTDTVLGIRKLGVLTGKVTDYSSVIASLNSTLTSLKGSLGSVSSSVYAPASGYYFSTTDGYEDIFSVSDVDALTFSAFRDMVSRAEERTPATENSLGKMVWNFRWYVACPMSTVEASSMKEKSTYSVTFENNAESIDMELYKVLSDSTDAVAVFRCDRIPDGFDFTRCQKIAVTVSSFEGFRIPASALRVHEDMEGVFILDEVTVRFCRISISHESGGYFYCNAVVDAETPEVPETDSADTSESTSEEAETDKPYYRYLRENDIVITSGTGLYEGLTLDLR